MSFQTAALVRTFSAGTLCSRARSAAALAQRLASSAVGGRPKATVNMSATRASIEAWFCFTSSAAHTYACWLTSGSFSSVSAWAGVLVTSRAPIGIFGGGWLNSARNFGGSMIVTLV